MTIDATGGGTAVARFETAHDAVVRAKRRVTILASAAFLAAFLGSAWVAEVNPHHLLIGLPGAWDYVERTLPALRWATLVPDLAEWYWGLWRWSRLLFDTVVTAGLATFLGFCFAYLACFYASRNLNPSATGVWVVRRLLELARGVPDLVYALIFVFAFGFGPMPGVLAITVHSTGALGKLFAEVNENVDLRAVDGVRAAGAGWWQAMVFAVSPQVMPNFLSYGLLRFEINLRSAAVLGFVGAGGIGEELMIAVRQFIYPDISAIVLMIVACVAVIDIACEGLRGRFIGEGRH